VSRAFNFEFKVASWVPGFRVQGCRIWGVGCRVQGSGFRV
jgi:hypothetical protein